jgi:ABC-2 type transport system ATP-binding protein
MSSPAWSPPLLDRFPVVDLEVNDPPIDALIGDLFRQGRV